ncbi:hypothetical protein [Streptomyces sp. SP18CS02]|uniref:hypothetical protein n=1 Tax=Streptomyces sp. SP18CS02 TaxID=3002531 RepID=UPI002E79DB8A|nr:hypothetical protein [Streptomyces sp. SP18CS02]
MAARTRRRTPPAAVDLARDMGFLRVENDVQRTRDGGLDVVQDDDRPAGTADAEQRFPGRSPWKAEDLTAAETSTPDAGGRSGVVADRPGIVRNAPR